MICRLENSWILLILLVNVILLAGCTQQTKIETTSSTIQISTTSTSPIPTNLVTKETIDSTSTTQIAKGVDLKLKETTTTAITTTTTLNNANMSEEDKMEEIKYAEVYLGLRNIALTSEIQESDQNKPYAVLMEFHRPNGVVTLASFSAGDTSLYFSNGGGILGSGTTESVASTSKTFVKDSANYIQYGEKVTEFPHPKKEEVLFYIRTKEGVYLAKDTLENIEKGKSQLTKLYSSGNIVITAVSLQQKK
jgi:hypothetical protein